MMGTNRVLSPKDKTLSVAALYPSPGRTRDGARIAGIQHPTSNKVILIDWFPKNRSDDIGVQFVSNGKMSWAYIFDGDIFPSTERLYIGKFHLCTGHVDKIIDEIKEVMAIHHSNFSNQTRIRGIILDREYVDEDDIEEGEEKGFLVDCGEIYVNLSYYKNLRIGDFIDASGRLDIKLIREIKNIENSIKK